MKLKFELELKLPEFPDYIELETGFKIPIMQLSKEQQNEYAKVLADSFLKKCQILRDQQLGGVIIKPSAPLAVGFISDETLKTLSTQELDYLYGAGELEDAQK